MGMASWAPGRNGGGSANPRGGTEGDVGDRLRRLPSCWALLLGLSACASESGPPPPSVRHLDLLWEEVEVVRPPASNLPEALKQAFEFDPPRRTGEEPERSQLRPTDRRLPRSMSTFAFALDYPARVDEGNELRIAGQTIPQHHGEVSIDGPRWFVDARTQEGVLVVPAGTEIPPGPIQLDYALEESLVRSFDRALFEGTDESFLIRDLTVETATWRSLYLPAPTTLAWTLKLPAGARLRFDAGLRPLSRDEGDGARLQITVEGAEGKRDTWSEELRPEAEPRPVEIELSAFAEQHVRLTLAADPGPSGDPIDDYLFLGAPRIVAEPAPGATRPNVVFVLFDTLRADHLSCYGYERPTSPNLDRLAEKGVRFSNARAQSSWTRASMASVFTSLYPSQHRIVRLDFTQTLPRSFTTLAEHLRRGGYATGSFVNNPQLGPDFGLQQGFDINVLQNGHAAELTQTALEWVDRNADAPFFLYLHLTDPHDPYVEREEFDFLPDYEGRVFNFVEDLIESREEMFRRAANRATEDWEVPYIEITPDELAKMIALYDGEIAYTDQQFGLVLDWLEERSLSDTTFVLATSDHGEEFLDHGGFFHGYTLYEELVHVPLILAGPNLPQGLVLDQPTTHIDLLPTLLDACMLPPPEIFMGQSLLPWIRGGTDYRPSPSMMETGYRVPHRIATADDGQKLVYQTVSGAVEIYDLAEDRAEQHDRSSEHEARAVEARSKLAEWKERQFELFAPFFEETEERQLPASTVEELRKLGYVDGED